MIVWVDDRLFADGARDVDRIALLRGAALRHHTLIVSPEPTDGRGSRACPSFDGWTSALPERLRREVTLLRERLDVVPANAAARGALRLLVSSRPPSSSVAGCWVSLDEAVRAVVQPTYVLVENAINDRAFLTHAMPPAWRARLEAWEHAGLLRYENAGGNSVMCTIIERHADDAYARAAFGLPSKVWSLLHVVVYDHDGDAPDMPHKDSERVKQTCAAVGLSERSHRLGRKSQEYYLPREALEQAARTHAHIGEPDRAQHLQDIDAHMATGEGRHFRAYPALGKYFKNAFAKDLDWKDEWFERDGAWPEMTKLAEKIAAAI